MFKNHSIKDKGENMKEFNNKKTKYQSVGNIKLTIKIVLIYIFIQIVLVLFNLDNPIFISILIIINVFFVFYCLYVMFGIVKGLNELNKENKYVKKTNPYVYFRELPNLFGIGVTSLLMDSAIENYKDVVAAILDLCAKQYLNLTKQGDRYIIKILKNIDDKLLSNEKYILSLILDNDIKNINYKEWFDYCMQDGVNLGLYTHEIKKNKLNKPVISRQERIKQDNKIKFVISFILFCIVFLLTFNFIGSLIFLGISYLILTLIFNIKLFFREMFKEAKYYKNQNYLNQLNNRLVKTDKGINELHKLYSFKAFIKDFGHFVDKNPEEVVLWDRYLSYAQVFGLTKKIMESGYDKLINNSSFCIDSMDNIKLYNIEVNTKI